MKPRLWNRFVAQYQAALAAYLDGEDERHLAGAYELGRKALSSGVGVVDMARMHGDALEKLLALRPALRVTPRRARAMETFLMEALSAFEVAHRGFRDACDRLQRLNEALAQRATEMTAANKRLAREIAERRQAELELRRSREHYIQLFKQARAMEENLRRLSNRVLTAQEEERKHISRELHDEIGQALTAANVSIAMLRAHAADDPVFARKVEGAQKLLEQSMEMVHRFARELRPSMLDHLGPVAALRNYVKSFVARTGIKVDLDSDPRVERVDNQQGTVLFRVAQESLTNVFKHAHATRVRIRLRQSSEGVAMEISDNGRRGFSPREKLNPTPRQGNGRLGLLGMQERVRLVNGQFAIESVPNRGTTVRVEIPLRSEAPPRASAALGSVSPQLSAAN